jgi:hypothetical protein
VQKVCVSETLKTLDAQPRADSTLYNTFAASQPRQQYDDTTWQTPQNVEAGSHPGAEATLETSAALNAQLFAESASYNTFALPQPQPFEHEASSYPLNDLQPHTSMKPWTKDPTPLVGGHLQSLAAQLPGLPLEDQFVFQPYMNNNPIAGQHGQILGELPEFPTMFDLGTAGDQAYHTNTWLHPDPEISTLGYGRGYPNFNTPLPSDAVSLDLYRSTPQDWQFGSNSSAFPGPSQQLNLPSFGAGPFQGDAGPFQGDAGPFQSDAGPFQGDAGPFQDGTDYNLTQSQHYADAAPSFGASSRHVQGNWPDTFDRSYQISTLGVSPYQDGKHFHLQYYCIPYCFDTSVSSHILSHVRHRLTYSSISPRCSYFWE